MPKDFPVLSDTGHIRTGTPDPLSPDQSLNDRLKLAYHDILATVDVRLFGCRPTDGPHAGKDTGGLSDLFLCTAPHVWAAGRRVMIVGRETRGWNIGHPFMTLDAYIDQAMQTQENCIAKRIGKKQQPQSTFFNFFRAVSRIFGNGNVAYANLFCMDDKGTTPTPAATPYYTTIRDLSERLLKAQIRCLRPEIIIFANGISTANVRREYFPVSGPEATCSDFRSFDGIDNKRLWAFRLYGDIMCYRINHPSSWRAADVRARRYLLQMLTARLNVADESFSKNI